MEFELAKEEYNKFRTIFYNHLSKFDSWEEYKKDYLSLNNTKYDKNEFSEKFLTYLYSKISTKFLNKYPFLKKYNNLSKEYKIIATKKGGIRVKIEFYNGIKESDLWYPNFTECISVHSAIHSLAMFLICKDQSRNDQFALHMHPLLAYPGDKEYTLYYLSQYYFPTIILTRTENLSWFLQTNLLPKVYGGVKGGRWCTRVFKIEPALLFYLNYFYPWEYSFSVNELKQFCLKNNISFKTNIKKEDLIKLIKNRLKTKTLTNKRIKAPNKTKYKRNFRKYQLYKYNFNLQEWSGIDYITNEFPEYKKIILRKGNKTLIDWKKTGNKILVNNLVQLTGINKYHSKKRAKYNPNIKLWNGSKPSKNFFIYEYYPIYDFDISDMKKVTEQSILEVKQNPFEKESSLAFQKKFDIKKEQRFGCIICPYKPIQYYINLRNKYPWQYYYCMTIRLIGSAKNIIEEGEEYWYQGKNVECPIM